MKKQLTILFALCLAGASVNNSSAQTSRASTSDALITSVKLDNHNIFADDLLKNVQEKFQKQFPNVKVESWIQTKDGYAIRFSAGSVENLVFYNSRANITGKIRYYKENNLPLDVLSQVESSYHAYNIIYVEEVTVERSTTYLIAIEAKNEWKIIRVNESGMDVYKEYQKG